MVKNLPDNDPIFFINIFTESKQFWITCIKRKKKNGWMKDGIREGKKTILDPLQRL